MIIKELKNIGTKIYEETLPCGLKIYVCPLERHEAHARIVTNFGGSNLEFKPAGSDDFIKVPEGTAHFLEHKMFEQKDGVDIMDIFQKNGAMSNAYTNAFHTTYYFTAPNHFYENLTNLLKCVTEPYYTDENVKSEVGIIEQEIKAGLDHPGNKAYHTTIYNVFKNLPFRYPVAGSTKSIRQINTKTLYDCYNTFYHPSNMHLVITGNIDPEECIKFVRDFYQKLKLEKHKPIINKEYNESAEVYKEKEIVNKNITNKLIEIAYKVNVSDVDMPLYKIKLYINIYLRIKFGNISRFNKETFQDKNVLTPVSFYITIVNDKYFMIDFDTEVIKEKDIFDKINNNIASKDINEREFELIKKNYLTELILSADSIFSLAEFIDTSLKQYKKIPYDIHQIITSLNYDELKRVIDKLDFTHHTMTIVQKG